MNDWDDYWTDLTDSHNQAAKTSVVNRALVRCDTRGEAMRGIHVPGHVVIDKELVFANIPLEQ
jgi:hypothetical protein